MQAQLKFYYIMILSGFERSSWLVIRKKDTTFETKLYTEIMQCITGIRGHNIGGKF